MKAQFLQLFPWTLLLALSPLGCGSSVSGGGGEGGTGATGSGTANSGSGGAGGNAVSCDSLPEVPKLAVCVRPKNNPMPPPSAFTVSLSGPILAMGDLSSPDSCFSGGTAYFDPNSFWFEAADSNAEIWTAGLSFPGLTKTLAPGDMIAADISYEFGGWGPTISSFTLRDGNGNLLAYIGEGGDITDLIPPQGISVAQGATICSQSDSCGDWSAYNFDVTIEGTTKSVGYGVSDTIGSYRVVHGGYERATAYSMMCADWYIAHAELGIAPLP